MRDYSGRTKKILKEKDLSVTDFCRIIGLTSWTTIYLIIKDNIKPSGNAEDKIINTFPDISEKWLLYGIGEYNQMEEDKQAKEEDRTVTAQHVIDYIKKKSKKEKR